MQVNASGGGQTSSSIDDKLSGITLDGSYVSLQIPVTSVEVEAKVGASPLTNRRLIALKNNGPDTVYYGPTGVAASGAAQGIDIPVGGIQSISVGPNIRPFLICAAGSSAQVVVQEFS